MSRSTRFVLPTVAAALVGAIAVGSVTACCPAPREGQSVVNADQTVLMIWDAANETQHFIRRASFASAADDFGFLVPTPSQPELSESGNDVFPYFQKLTEPAVKVVKRSGGSGCSCLPQLNAPPAVDAKPAVAVLERKVVAGLDAAVLAAESADALTGWLKDHGYAYSPAIAAWAKPYVDRGWKITALKVAKSEPGSPAKDVTATALRMSFKTKQPLFPYREPDYGDAAAKLGTTRRLLHIYFVADGRYQGTLTPEVPWTGRVAWSGKLQASQRTAALDMLKLPQATGPAEWWLTEFEDAWPYRVAPADVLFARDTNQSTVERLPVIHYVAAPLPADGAAYLLTTAMIVPPVLRRLRRKH